MGLITNISTLWKKHHRRKILRNIIKKADCVKKIFNTSGNVYKELNLKEKLDRDVRRWAVWAACKQWNGIEKTTFGREEFCAGWIQGSWVDWKIEISLKLFKIYNLI